MTACAAMIDVVPAADPTSGTKTVILTVHSDNPHQPSLEVSLSATVAALDSDGTGVADSSDNCLLDANSDQRDTNGGGFGNICNPDLNDDGVINAVDLGILRAGFLGKPGPGTSAP